ncbi:MAG: GGDEF domain-containing protein [Planctomycetota bacterium]
MLNFDNASNAEAQPVQINPISAPTASADMTVQQNHGHQAPGAIAGKDSCLVQIYPADVIDGMMLLDTEALNIGRDFECDLTLNDGNVSRRHARIKTMPGGHVITDAGSTNGTFVNGQKVDTYNLRSGDRIAVGPFIFKYLSAGCIEAHYHEAVYSSLTRDALTGAFNKRYLLEAMQREISRSRRDKQSIAIVMMDIDHFKSVNDNYGHLVGDEVLREFGRRLLDICREDDLFARYGGEEFSLLLASTSAEQAVEIANRCRQAIAEKPFSTEAGDLQITASFGIECYNGSRKATGTDLIGIADERLYQAKQAGRNCVIC